MKWLRCILGLGLLLAVMVGCGSSPDSPALTGTPSQRGTASRTLENIDSLMWRQPDSAFAMLQEFASSAAADSLDEFNGHYCQVLIAELLYKNYYKQSNRKELLKAVHYFDSIVGMDGADAYGKADTRGVSVQELEAFLAARAHYINGVGYYERDSLIKACGEYLNALRMMEGHFEEKVLVGHKARFMTLTYNRLGDLFSAQFMQEPAIYCCKKSLDYDRIAQASPDKIANTLLQLGKQFGKLKEYDSAAYYFDEALKQLPDTNNLIFRDLISARAFLYYQMGKGVEPSVNDLRRMAIQTTDETEKLNRYLTIGSIYSEEVQYDSALVYLTPVFENMEDAARQRIAA